MKLKIIHNYEISKICFENILKCMMKIFLKNMSRAWKINEQTCWNRIKADSRSKSLQSHHYKFFYAEEPKSSFLFPPITIVQILTITDFLNTKVISKTFLLRCTIFTFITKAILKAVSYTHLRAHETSLHLVCRLLLEKTLR